MNTTITYEQLNEFYKTMASSQATSYSNLINALWIIVTLTIGVAVFWNIYMSKKHIETAVAEEINKRKSDIDKEIEEKMNKVEINMNNKILQVRADVDRSLGLAALKENIPISAFNNLMSALQIYIKNEEGKMARVIANTICTRVITHPKFIEDAKANDDFNIDKVMNLCNRMPDILYKEKKQIIEKLKEVTDITTSKNQQALISPSPQAKD